jgi:hypothetical protein
MSSQYRGTFYAVIDDTVIERASKKAPGAAFHHMHSQKPNRPRFINGQCLVSLCGAARLASGKVVSLPFRGQMKASGKSANADKLSLATLLVAKTTAVLGGLQRTVLCDSWYMRRRFIDSCLENGWDVIGQARIDTALYEIPTERKLKRRGRGRPRKYGRRIPLGALRRQRKWESTEIEIYGKKQRIVFRSIECYAKFLGTKPVRAVWVGMWSLMRFGNHSHL